MKTSNFASYASIGFAIVTLVVGLYAALLWFKASKIPIDPGWGTGGIEDGHLGIEPVDPVDSQGGWIMAIIKASLESAELNKRAALWTGVAVILGTVSNLISALSNCF